MGTTEEQVQDEQSTTEQEEPQEAPSEDSPALRQSVQAMFTYSDYVHVGAGAQGCEDRENGNCSNPLHFHAWIRLPNPIQKASIREKAEAAKARKVRQLRDPDSDSYMILESEIDEIRRSISNHTNREMLVDSLLAQNAGREQHRIIREMNEEDEWKTFHEDKSRFDYLDSLPENERPHDEFEELKKHLNAYTEEVQRRLKEAQEPERQSLMGLDDEDLLEMTRDAKIAQRSDLIFNETWTTWQMYVMTLKPVEEGTPHERYFKDMNELNGAAPEVIEALEEGFNRLEYAISARGAVGN